MLYVSEVFTVLFYSAELHMYFVIFLLLYNLCIYSINAWIDCIILNKYHFLEYHLRRDISSNIIIPSNCSRVRTSHQRYSSDDLYKPRPLFSSSSRRSRRSNQA